ncbi:hypothetical protein [Sporofaciens sp. SGI.106]|uniref:hypothetical protein n=1 Tax=Sporofaciens sp. SGI.106 TaxID=3420568 RepID=UPI003D00025F
MRKKWMGLLLAGLLFCTMGLSSRAAEGYFDELQTPDYEELGLKQDTDEEKNYSMDACDGKIYIAGGNLKVEKEGKEYPVVLVYNEEEETWGTIWATFLGTEGELQLVAGDDKLYLLENKYTQLNVFAYDLSTKEVKELASFNHERRERGNSLLYDGNYIWMIGGAYQDEEGKIWEPHGEIKRLDVKNGKMEVSELQLSCPCYDAQSELFENRIIVAGGINAEGKWEKSTEIIDMQNQEIVKGADYPECYDGQIVDAASGSFDGKMVVSGMILDEAHTTDTFLYDSAEDTWSALPDRLTDGELSYSDGVVSGCYFYVYGVEEKNQSKEHVFRRLKVREKEELSTGGDEDEKDVPQITEEKTDENADLEDTKEKESKSEDGATKIIFLVCGAVAVLGIGMKIKQIIVSKKKKTEEEDRREE